VVASSTTSFPASSRACSGDILPNSSNSGRQIGPCFSCLGTEPFHPRCRAGYLPSSELDLANFTWGHRAVVTRTSDHLDNLMSALSMSFHSRGFRRCPATFEFDPIRTARSGRCREWTQPRDGVCCAAVENHIATAAFSSVGVNRAAIWARVGSFGHTVNCPLRGGQARPDERVDSICRPW